MCANVACEVGVGGAQEAVRPLCIFELDTDPTVEAR
jgi:hypothetical protein